MSITFQVGHPKYTTIVRCEWYGDEEPYISKLQPTENRSIKGRTVFLALCSQRAYGFGMTGIRETGRKDSWEHLLPYVGRSTQPSWYLMIALPHAYVKIMGTVMRYEY